MYRRPLSALVCVVVLLAGCTRKPDEAAAPPAAPEGTPETAAPAADAATETAPPAASTSDASPPDAAEDTDSSLSIKRGIAKSMGDHTVFRLCDEAAELWLIDEGDDMLAQLFAEDMQIAYVEVYGERAPVPDDLPAARNNPGVFVLEQLLYAGAPDKNGNCITPPADAIVTGRGNEPSWSVRVTDTKATWKLEQAKEITLDTLQAQDAEGTVSYRAKSTDHELELVIAAQPCRDLVSKEYFAFAARATFDGKEFKGCARVGR